MPFPFCELSYDLQRLVACAVLDPRDRAALCLAQPRLGLQLTDKATGVAPYTDFIFRVGMELPRSWGSQRTAGPGPKKWSELLLD